MDILKSAAARKIAIDDNILELLKVPASVVALGISGGKDSDAMTLQTVSFLREIGYQGEICLVHSDLGLIEHAESKDQCNRLSEKLGIELFVIEPPRPMLEVWEYRWQGILDRFIKLERVKIITPFSSAKLRFCTQSTKVSPITQFLKNKYPNKIIINAVGIRGEESAGRAKKPISQVNDKLRSVKLKTTGYDWFPIIGYKLEEIWLTHQKFNFPRHPAYDRGMDRISCAYCVLGSKNDLKVSIQDERNRASFYRILELEAISGFSFRDNDWLADYGLEFLDGHSIEKIKKAKELMGKRRLLEKKVHPDLFLTDGFPPFQPNLEQCQNMADFRRQLGDLYQIKPLYLTAQDVFDRYAELIVLRDAKRAAQREANNNLSGSLPIQPVLF